MTYKLEPGLVRIMSPILLRFPDGAKKEYQSGTEMREMAFDRKYRVTEIRAAGDRIEIRVEHTTTPIINPIGEETFY